MARITDLNRSRVRTWLRTGQIPSDVLAFTANLAARNSPGVSQHVVFRISSVGSQLHYIISACRTSVRARSFRTGTSNTGTGGSYTIHRRATIQWRRCRAGIAMSGKELHAEPVRIARELEP